MTNNSIYTTNRKHDHVDILYAILNLSTLGAAATDSMLKIEQLLDAHRTMYETIHKLAH